MKNEQLTMKNQKVSTRKYPSYKDSGIEWLGEVPAHWEVRRAKDISQIFVPQRDKPELKDEDGIPWVTTELLGGKVLDMNKVNYFVSDEEVKAKKIRKVPVNSVLVTCVGEFSLTAINKFPVIINQQIQAYSYLKKTYPEFVSYQIQAKVSKDYFEKSSTETTLKYLNKEKFSLLVIYLPPLSEQIAIANYLDIHTAKIDKKIELLTKKATLYANLKQSLINETVTRGLNKKMSIKETGTEWNEYQPVSWNIKRVKDIFKLVTDIAPDENNLELLSLYTSIGVKPRSEMEARGNKASTTDGYWIVKKGDIIVNKLLAWMGAIGLSAYDGVTSPAYDVLRRINRSIDQRFYTYLFRTEKAQEIFKKSSRGIMDMRLRLYFDKFGAIKIPVPPLHEQAAIADYLDNKTKSIDRIIEKIHLQIDKLKELRKALVNDVVTGKIRVADNG